MDINYKIKKAAAYMKHYGPEKLAKKAVGKLMDRDDYSVRCSQLASGEEELFYQRSMHFEKMPLISILVPVYNPPRTYFKEMLLSVLNQTYFHWQLCLVDAGTNKLRGLVEELVDGDERICYKEIDNAGIAGNTNEALKMAQGEYIALLDNDDTLSPDALYHIVEMINAEEPDCLYSDEDKMDAEGKKFFCPHIKPDYNPVLLQSNNYICHLFAVKTSLAREVGGFDSEYDGAQDYDFILKCTEKAERVSHVKRVLYHWRTHESSTSANPMSKMYAYEAGKKAIEAHLCRVGKKGSVKMLDDMGFYRVDYEEGNADDNADGGLPSVQIVVTGVRNSEKAQNYFRYIRNNTLYDNLKLCAMGEPDADRLEGCECDYICVLNGGTKMSDKKWLFKLIACAENENADAVAAKLLVKQAFPLCEAVNRTFIVYSGDDYIDAFGRQRTSAGKPEWYKGNFNRNILQCNVRTVPKNAVLLRREEFMRLIAEEWVSGEDAVYVYEPGVELYR